MRVYLTGGATAVLEGWRASTIDIDVRFEPASDEVLRELVAVKDRLGINVELTSPPDFIPELPGWRERSPLVFRDGNVDVHHFDPYSQALSKIERGFVHDLADVQDMRKSGLIVSRNGSPNSTRRSSQSCTGIRHLTRRPSVGSSRARSPARGASGPAWRAAQPRRSSAALRR
jgi:hypothetical protein